MQYVEFYNVLWYNKNSRLLYIIFTSALSLWADGAIALNAQQIFCGFARYMGLRRNEFKRIEYIGFMFFGCVNHVLTLCIMIWCIFI